MLKVGDLVYVTGTYMRYGDIIEAPITKIGRKYFYMQVYNRDYAVDINTLKVKGSSMSVYLDKQTILDNREREKLNTLIAKAFREREYAGYDLETARAIVELFKERGLIGKEE